MKIGQMVMLIQTKDGLPPTGATGVIHEECCTFYATRVMFGHHKNYFSSDGAYCVRRTWLVKIDDPDAMKKERDKDRLTDPAVYTLSDEDAVKIGRRMLKDLEKDDA